MGTAKGTDDIALEIDTDGKAILDGVTLFGGGINGIIYVNGALEANGIFAYTTKSGGFTLKTGATATGVQVTDSALVGYNNCLSLQTDGIAKGDFAFRNCVLRTEQNTASLVDTQISTTLAVVQGLDANSTYLFEDCEMYSGWRFFTNAIGSLADATTPRIVLNNCTVSGAHTKSGLLVRGCWAEINGGYYDLTGGWYSSGAQYGGGHVLIGEGTYLARTVTVKTGDNGVEFADGCSSYGTGDVRYPYVVAKSAPVADYTNTVAPSDQVVYNFSESRNFTTEQPIVDTGAGAYVTATDSTGIRTLVYKIADGTAPADWAASSKTVNFGSRTGYGLKFGNVSSGYNTSDNPYFKFTTTYENFVVSGNKVDSYFQFGTNLYGADTIANMAYVVVDYDIMTETNTFMAMTMLVEGRLSGGAGSNAALSLAQNGVLTFGDKTTTIPTKGTWTHITMIVQANATDITKSVLQVYVNGEYLGQTYTFTNANTVIVNGLRVGYSGGTYNTTQNGTPTFCMDNLVIRSFDRGDDTSLMDTVFNNTSGGHNLGYTNGTYIYSEWMKGGSPQYDFPLGSGSYIADYRGKLFDAHGLGKLVEYAQDGAEITLTKISQNIQQVSPITVDKKIAIDLAGNTVVYDDGVYFSNSTKYMSYMMTLVDGGDLEMYSSVDGATVQFPRLDPFVNIPSTNTAPVRLYLHDLTFTHGSNQGASNFINVQDTADVTVEGVTVKHSGSYGTFMTIGATQNVKVRVTDSTVSYALNAISLGNTLGLDMAFENCTIENRIKRQSGTSVASVLIQGSNNTRNGSISFKGCTLTSTVSVFSSSGTASTGLHLTLDGCTVSADGSTIDKGSWDEPGAYYIIQAGNPTVELTGGTKIKVLAHADSPEGATAAPFGTYSGSMSVYAGVRSNVAFPEAATVENYCAWQELAADPDDGCTLEVVRLVIATVGDTEYKTLDEALAAAAAQNPTPMVLQLDLVGEIDISDPMVINKNTHEAALTSSTLEITSDGDVYTFTVATLYTVTWKYDRNDPSKEVTEQYKAGAVASYPGEMSLGYVSGDNLWLFCGWTATEDGTSAEETLTVPACDVTYYTVYAQEPGSFVWAVLNDNGDVASYGDTDSGVSTAAASILDGQTLYLMSDITLGRNIPFSGWKTVTFDMNGHTLITTHGTSSLTSPNYAKVESVKLADGVTLTVKNGTIFNRNTYVADSTSTKNGAPAFVVSSSTLVVSDVSTYACVFLDMSGNCTVVADRVNAYRNVADYSALIIGRNSEINVTLRNSILTAASPAGTTIFDFQSGSGANYTVTVDNCTIGGAGGLDGNLLGTFYGVDMTITNSRIYGRFNVAGTDSTVTLGEGCYLNRNDHVFAFTYASGCELVKNTENVPVTYSYNTFDNGATVEGTEQTLNYTCNEDAQNLPMAYITARAEDIVTVNWNKGGKTETTEKYYRGSAATAPAVPDPISSGSYTVTFNGWDYDNAALTADAYTFEAEYTLTVGAKYNLSLYADFDVNFYLPTDITNVSFGEEEVTYGDDPVTVDGKEYNVYSVGRAANATTGDITLTVTVTADGQTYSVTYTTNIVDYTMRVLAMGDEAVTEAEGQMLVAMLEYAQQACVLLSEDHQPDATLAKALAHENAQKYEVPNVSGYDGETAITDDLKTVFVSAQLDLTSAPKFVFNVKDDFNGTVTISYNGKTVDRTFTGTQQNEKIEIDDLRIYNFDTTFRISVGGEEIGTYNLRAYTEAVALGAFPQALYNYIAAAKAYKTAMAG